MTSYFADVSAFVEKVEILLVVVDCQDARRSTRHVSIFLFLQASILGHKLPNHLKQLARTIGLCQVGRGASILRLLVVAAERERGDHNDRDSGGLGIGAKPGASRPAPTA